MKIIKKIQLKIVIFTAVKNHCILHGRVFIMLLPLAVTVLILEIVTKIQNFVKLIFKTFIMKPKVRSSREAFLSQNGLIKFY